jgi:integrase
VAQEGQPVTASHGNIHRREWDRGGKTRTAWEFAFTYQKDGKTLRARGQAPTRDEALQAMAARKAELAQAATAAAAAPTLAEYASKWLASIKPDVAQRTHVTYTDMFRRHVLPTLGATALPAITRGQIMALLSAKRAGGLGKNTVRLIRAAMSALFTDALNQELIAAHPAQKVGVGRGRKAPDTVSAGERREKVKALSRDQLDAFLAVASRERSWPLWLFLADTGCRPSEALAVCWEDIDLVGRSAHIHRALDLDGTTKRTKTNTGRYVDLSVRLVAALDRHQTSVEAAALAAGRDVNPLVFPSEAGTALDLKNTARTFRRLLVRAGLPKAGGPYLLRHTFASHLLGMSAPITYVANQMGHTTPAVTLNVYAHFLPSGDRAIADRLEAWRTSPSITSSSLVGK